MTSTMTMSELGDLGRARLAETTPALARARREAAAANRRADELKSTNARQRAKIRNLERRLERVARAGSVIDIARRLERAVNHGEGCWGDIEAELFAAVK